jgi:hypothetical protein
MFFLTKGFLKKAYERGSILNNPLTYSPTSSSLIKLRSYECPILVRVDSVNYFNRNNIIFLNLYDGETSLEVNFDISLWKLLASSDKKDENERKIDKGSVIIIYEYTFEDVKVDDRDNIVDMIKLMECSLVGTYTEITETIKTETASTSQKLTNNLKEHTVEHINIYLNNQTWLLRAKLLKITPVKEFVNKNNNLTGKFMRLQFGDSSGTIELVGFNVELLKIEKCSIDKFYKIMNADVKFTKGNTQAWDDTSVTKIELVLNKNTIIDEYTEEKEKLFKIFEKPQASSNENKQNKHLLSLREISEKKDGEFASTIAVINLVEDLKEITPKNKNPIKIRNFFITDQTMSSVKVAVWGKQAEEFSFSIGNIIILNKLKISFYNGLTLSVQWETAMMKIEENWDHIEEANLLREWWIARESSNLSSTLKRKLSIDNK